MQIKRHNGFLVSLESADKTGVFLVIHQFKQYADKGCQLKAKARIAMGQVLQQLMNYIQSISRVNSCPTMSYQQHSFITQQHEECFQQAKISPHHDPETHKPHRKKDKGEGEQRRERKKGEEQRSAGQNFGHWSLQENKRYHWFLEIHNQHFLNKHMRRMDKIFKSMALFVASREAEQCRSHHQKMEKKYNHSICSILLHLREEHYHSHATAPLAQDIADNGLTINAELLSERFLRGYEEEDDHLQSEMMDLLPQEAKTDQQGRQGYEVGVSLIDSLFEVDAPHNNFSLI